MAQLQGWKLGTIRGVPIYLHASLIFLMVYVFLIASAQFPGVASRSGVDLSSLHGSPYSWSFVFVFALLASVLLHELGHVWVAQALGTKVRSITLLMLGGVSQMDPTPEASEKKYSEFKVAVVGPLVSFAIAGGLIFLGRVTASADVGMFCYWLSRVNIVLGVFNLVPAFPMDGGRVLRSLLAARQGKLRGTQNAVKVSHVFAGLFGILGLLQFNLMLLLIAVFIYLSANAELMQLLGKSLLQGVQAGEVGKRLVVLSEDFKLDRVAALMIQNKSLLLPIQTDEGGLALISASQLKRVPRDLWRETPVKRVMSSVSEGIEVSAPLERALEGGWLTAGAGIPLLENGRVVGLLRGSDISELIEFRSLTAESIEERRAA